MVIDDIFMWLYWLHKAGNTCTVLAVASGITSAGLAFLGGMFALMPELANSEKEIEAGRKMLNGLWFSVPALIFFILVAGIAPSKDELKAYAAYRIGEKVVTSDEAQRLMNAALLYLEGKAQEK